MKLRYTSTALRQISDTLDYIGEHSPKAAMSVSKRIQALLSIVQSHPELGQRTDREGIRRLVVTPYPYVIFYRMRGEEIVVLRFRHAARKPV